MKRKMFWFMTVLMMCVIVASFHAVQGSASDGYSPKRILPLLKEINKAVNTEQWVEANNKGNQLQKIYKKNLWKLQLFGDEREYEQAEEEIRTLLTALKDKDKTESLMQISRIRTVISQLYSW